MFLPNDIEDMFKFHPPKDESVIKAHNVVRSAISRAAEEVISVSPASPELATAISKLREAMFWANSAISRNQTNRG